MTFRINAIEHNIETTKNIAVDNLIFETIDAETADEAVANYAEYFADQCRNNGNDAEIDNNDVTVNGNVYTFTATEI